MRTSTPFSFRKSRQRRGRRQNEQDAIVVVDPVVNLGVLGQVGQHAAVGDAGLDLGVERSLGQAPRGRLLRAGRAPRRGPR